MQLNLQPHTPIQFVAELNKLIIFIHFSAFWRPFWKSQGHQGQFCFLKSSMLQLFVDIWINRQLLITADYLNMQQKQFILLTEIRRAYVCL